MATMPCQLADTITVGANCSMILTNANDSLGELAGPMAHITLAQEHTGKQMWPIEHNRGGFSRCPTNITRSVCHREGLQD